MSQTLFERMGGQEGIEQVVDRFYSSILEDGRLNHFFSNTDMAKQREHQQRFLTYAFGGGPNYSEQSLRTSHARLQANHDHFDWVMEHLESALRESKFEESDRKEALERVEQYRGHIIH